MRRSLLVPVIAAVALVTAGAPVAASAVSSARTAATPAAVSAVQTFADRHGVTVSWIDPSTSFDHVVVRYRRGPHAPTHRHGRFRGHRVQVGRHATSATLMHLSRDTVFSVTIWTVNARGTRSASRHAHFTTGGGHVLRGRYTARFVDASGHALAGVVAYAADVDSEHEVTATTGRDGTVSFTLAAGEYFLGGEGEHATGGASDATGYVGHGTLATIRPGRVLRAGSLVLHAGGLVHVHVTDAQGRPAVGVIPSLAPTHQYVASDQGPDESFFDAYYSLASPHRTDSRGDTTLRAVPGGFPFRICVDPLSGPLDSTGSRFLAACSSTSQLAGAGRSVSSMTLVLHRHVGATVRGVVRAHDRGGFANSYVEVLDGAKPVASGTTLRDGTFRINGVPSGTYRVCTTAGGFSQAGPTGYLPGCDTRPVTVTGSSTSRSSTIVVQPGSAVSGTVTAMDGTPAVGADVQLSRSHDADAATADANGHYRLKGLPPGPHHACVFTDNMVPTASLPFGLEGTCGHSHLHVTSVAARDRTGVDVRLRTAAAIDGTVVDRAGHAVPYAVVDAEPDGPGDPTEAVADAHGRYRVIGLVSGRYRVCAGLGDSPFYTEIISGCRHGLVPASTGRLAKSIRIPVPVTSNVRVTVMDDASRPVAGVDATVIKSCRDDCDPGTPLFPKNTSVAASATTDGHGDVALDGLLPGRYAVCLFAYYGTTRRGAPSTGYADRCSGVTFDVVVHPGRVTAKRLVLHQGGAVSGRITDSAGDPLQGVFVHVHGSAADDLPAEDTEYTGPTGDPYVDEDGGAGAAPGYYSRTAADGTYTVRSVRPGDQPVCVDPSAAAVGTSSEGYLPQCVGGAVGSRTKGTPVDVRSGETAGAVDLSLTAGASVTGQAISHVARGLTAVVLFRGQKYVKQTHPDTSGVFRFRTLIPGTYSVCVAAYGRSTNGRCYRDAAWDPDTATGPASDATPVQVTTGVATTGIDITVPR